MSATDKPNTERPQRIELLIKQYGRVKIGIDGDCGYALLGSNIQEGEAEFVRVVPEDGDEISTAQYRARMEAYRCLLRRLGKTRDQLSYYVEQ